MKVEHILVSLLFVFLLYHFTCKCRVEGITEKCNKVYERDYYGYIPRPGDKKRDYCIYGEDDKVPGSCMVVGREDEQTYDEIYCKDGLNGDDKTKWGICEGWSGNRREHTWVYDPKNPQQLKCVKCDGDCQPADMRNSPLNTD